MCFRRQFRNLVVLLAAFALTISLPAALWAQAAQLRPEAVAYGLDFEERSPQDNPFPKLQSYAYAVTKGGEWLLLGGRTQGLHSFGSKPENFKKFNDEFFVLNPESGKVWSLSIASLSAELRDPLVCTNPQEYHDKQTDTLFIVGGYGRDTRSGEMVTFDTITAFNVSQVAAAVKSGDALQLARLIRQSRDERLAVTGGGLEKLGHIFYLVFGQNFMGEYIFDGPPQSIQKYTEEVRIFLLDEQTLRIKVYDAVGSQDQITHPFHRRDLNVLTDIDPLTGQERIAVFGGVFPPARLVC